jgi:hypothetical protein
MHNTVPCVGTFSSMILPVKVATAVDLSETILETRASCQTFAFCQSLKRPPRSNMTVQIFISEDFDNHIPLLIGFIPHRSFLQAGRAAEEKKCT